MNLSKELIRKKLISNGFLALRAFGYPGVNSENILTDEIYSSFYKELLLNNKGQDKEIDLVIDGLLSEIELNSK